MADSWERTYFNDRGDLNYPIKNNKAWVFKDGFWSQGQQWWGLPSTSAPKGTILKTGTFGYGLEREITSYLVPPHYSVVFNTWSSSSGHRKTTKPCGKRAVSIPNDQAYSAVYTACDTWDDFKAKCCLSNQWTGPRGSNPYEPDTCRIFANTNNNNGRCDQVVKNWCKKSANQNRPECRCFNPQVPQYIRTSLEKAGQLGKLWGFDNVCTGSTSSYKPDFARRDINFTLNHCEQVINVSDNKNLLMSNNEFNQFCGSAITDYQKKLLDQLTNLIEENNINVFTDFTKEEVITYNNCVKQINENADSSCVETNIKPIISKVKERKVLIEQNIAKFTKLPSQYGIQDSDLPSMGEYSMMDFNNCRSISIPKGNFQCITDFENYFKQVQQKKIEAQAQAELLRQQQEAASVYTGDGDLGSYTQTKKSTTEVPDYQPDTVGSSDVTPSDIINALEGKEPTTGYQQPSIGSSYQQPISVPAYQPQYTEQGTSDYTTYIIIGVLLILLIVIFVLVIGVVAYGSIGGAYEKVKSKLKK